MGSVHTPLLRGDYQACTLLRALGNERRLMVLCLLLENEEMSVGALGEYVDLSQSALSQHLAKMREEGLVACRKEAQTVHYRIADPRVKTLILSLKEIFCP
jgi:DNA-binding transcriptional ArsR family regulator